MTLINKLVPCAWLSSGALEIAISKLHASVEICQKEEVFKVEEFGCSL